MWAYFDTSALVKRYVDERGRREVLRLLRRHEVVTSAIAAVELRSAFTRRTAEGTLNDAQLGDLLRQSSADREFWALVSVSRRVLRDAETLVAGRPLRTLDALHVASAQLFATRVAVPLLFVTADRQQSAAAAAVGLTPNFVET